MGAFETLNPFRQVQATDALAPWLLRTTLALMRGALRSGCSLDELLARHPALHDTLDAAAERGLAELRLDDALHQLARGLRPGRSAVEQPTSVVRRQQHVDLLHGNLASEDFFGSSRGMGTITPAD